MRELQAAYNRLGIAEAVAVQSSRPPLPIFSFDRVSTSIELDIERQVVASILSLATWPTRSKIAGVRIEQAELRAAGDPPRRGGNAEGLYPRRRRARDPGGAERRQGQRRRECNARREARRDGSGRTRSKCTPERQVVATELGVQVTAARQGAAASEEQLTRLMGLWGPDLGRVLPRALPSLRGKSPSPAAVEQEAMDRRVDLAVARLEVEALARSYGLTRSTRLINVLDASGISKTQKDTGEPAADGGGFDIALEVPIYDFGRARTREAEQRYLEALNALAAMAVNARSEAREAYGAYASTRAIAVKYEREVLPLRKTISEQTELQYNAMQVDAFVLLDAARANDAAKVASIEAKRNFWIAATDLSVAVLGGGRLSPIGGTVIAAGAASE